MKKLALMIFSILVIGGGAFIVFIGMLGGVGPGGFTGEAYPDPDPGIAQAILCGTVLLLGGVIGFILSSVLIIGKRKKLLLMFIVSILMIFAGPLVSMFYVPAAPFLFYIGILGVLLSFVLRIYQGRRDSVAGMPFNQALYEKSKDDWSKIDWSTYKGPKGEKKNTIADE